MTREGERRKRLRDQGLCPACKYPPKPLAQGHSLCEYHINLHTAQTAARREKRSASGVCIEPGCYTVPAGGAIRCFECLEKVAAGSRAWCTRPENKAKRREYMKKYRAKNGK